VVQGGLGLSRWWLVLLAPVALLSMLFGATPAEETYAQAPAATATPTFVWLVPNSARGNCGLGNPNNDNCLHIDPINQQFVYYPDKRTPNAAPIAAKVRDMQVSQQRVSWKWNDASKTYFVWGTVDRVRKTVRMTLWRRESNGVAQTHLFNSGTPRTLPVANDPRIVIQDNKFVPNRLVINRHQQVNFQNQMRQAMAIRFRDPPRSCGEPSQPCEPSDPTWAYQETFDLYRGVGLPRGELLAGRVAPPFPLRPRVLPTPVPNADPPVFWEVGDHFYRCAIHPNFKGGVITVRDD
jgi:hypothetical protein